MNLVEVMCLVSSALALLWFAGLSVTVAVADVRWRRIPNRVVLPALIGMPVVLAVPLLVALVAGTSADTEAQSRSLLDGCLGALALFVGYLMLVLLGGLGCGDVKLAAILGLQLGYFGGWGAVLLGTLLAWVTAGVVGVACAAPQRMKGPHDLHASRDPPTLPFAPFLLGGAWIVLLAGG